MTQVRRTFVTSLVMALVAVAGLYAQGRARIWGVVSDPNGVPLPDVRIVVSDPDEGRLQLETTTNNKGRYTIALVDATRPYLYRFEKEGFVPLEESIKVPILSNTRRDFTLVAGDVRPGTPGTTAPGEGPAANIYNDGVLDLRAGDLASAQEKFERALERDPQFGMAYAALSQVHFKQEQWEAARDRAAQALAINAEDQTALSVLYQAHEKLGDAQQSKEVYQRLEALVDPGVAAYNRGAEAFQAGDLAKAKQKFLEAAEVEPELAAAHAALARLYFDEQNYAEAAAAAERALALDAENAIGLSVRYDSYRALGDEAKAQQAFAALKAAAPDRLAANFFDQAVQLFNDNQMGEAKKLLVQALAIEPDHAKAHYMLGIALVNTGDTAGAKQHLERYLELAPDDSEAGTAREMLKYLE